MTSELRPAKEVVREIYGNPVIIGASLIEVELSMCAIANVEAPSEWIDGFEFAWKRVKEALLQYKEARDAS